MVRIRIAAATALATGGIPSSTSPADAAAPAAPHPCCDGWPFCGRHRHGSGDAQGRPEHLAEIEVCQAIGERNRISTAFGDR